jgi:hypothetical protein
VFCAYDEACLIARIVHIHIHAMWHGARLILALLLVDAAVAGRTPDPIAQHFLFDREADQYAAERLPYAASDTTNTKSMVRLRRVVVYSDNLLRSTTIPIAFTPPTQEGHHRMFYLSKGMPHRLFWMHGENHTHPTISVGLSSTNALWARWPYAVIANLTMWLARELSPAMARADTIFSCDVHQPGRFCDVGYVLADDGAAAVSYGVYRLVFNPDSPRSSLPPHLYFLLTNGRALLNNGRGSGTTGLTLDQAASVNCVRLRTLNATISTPLLLCDGDAAHFDMQELEELRDTIVIGGSFWRSNYTSVTIDGMHGRFSVQYEAAAVGINMDAVGWASSAISLFSLLILYGRWSSGPNTLSLSLMLTHLTDAKNGYTWTVDYRLRLALCCSWSRSAANIVAWMAYASGTLALSGPYFDMLLITYAVYAIIETVIAVALLVYDGSPRRIPAVSFTSWLRSHDMDIDWMWQRHLAYVTAACATTVLALTPLAYVGGTQ